MVWKFFGKSQFPNAETMRKLCLSIKLSHKEIRWNYSILCSASFWNADRAAAGRAHQERIYTSLLGMPRVKTHRMCDKFIWDPTLHWNMPLIHLRLKRCVRRMWNGEHANYNISLIYLRSKRCALRQFQETSGCYAIMN